MTGTTVALDEPGGVVVIHWFDVYAPEVSVCMEASGGRMVSVVVGEGIDDCIVMEDSGMIEVGTLPGRSVGAFGNSGMKDLVIPLGVGVDVAEDDGSNGLDTS